VTRLGQQENVVHNSFQHGRNNGHPPMTQICCQGSQRLSNPFPNLTQKQAEAIEAATQTVVATTTTMTESSSGTVIEHDTLSVSNDAATSPPTITGTIPLKQRGYNLNPAKAGNLFISRTREREDADRDSKNPATEPVTRHETDTEDELCDSLAIAARDLQQADGVPVVAQVQPALAGHNAFIQSRWE
jgi:CCR4-NOT transcriptional regulation complex NOT5 subunit